jgi:hypothetical protein
MWDRMNGQGRGERKGKEEEIASDINFLWVM